MEPMQEKDFTTEDLDMAVHQLEPLLKFFYDGAKADSKWKGQVAYHQLSPKKAGEWRHVPILLRILKITNGC